MRVIHTDDPKCAISQLKCHMEVGQMRLTFMWPEGTEQVYVFKAAGSFNGDFNIENAGPGQLFTLQEYKQNGGYIAPRPSGAFVYYIYPFVREGGVDNVIVYSGDNTGNVVEVTGQIPIQFSISEKSGFLSRDKVYTVTLLSHQSLAEDVLCYVKKAGSYPADAGDGTMYFFGDKLVAGMAGRWEIRTKKDEYIRVFVRDPEMAGVYLLKGSTNVLVR